MGFAKEQNSSPEVRRPPQLSKNQIDVGGGPVARSSSPVYQSGVGAAASSPQPLLTQSLPTTPSDAGATTTNKTTRAEGRTHRMSSSSSSGSAGARREDHGQKNGRRKKDELEAECAEVMRSLPPVSIKDIQQTRFGAIINELEQSKKLLGGQKNFPAGQAPCKWGWEVEENWTRVSMLLLSA